jgi:hypothetical protein
VLPTTWQLTEFQPNVPNGGRANTIAVNPSDSRVMIVASETGGLFRTSDEGITWTHIDTLVPYAMFAVTYVPTAPNIVIATAGEGFLTQNAGGILRSSVTGTLARTSRSSIGMSALPPNQTFAGVSSMSPFGPKADSCAASTIDQLVGAFEHCRRDSQTERSSRL